MDNTTTKKKRGRPKGSKNLQSRKKKQQRNELATAQEAFEKEFGIGKRAVDDKLDKSKRIEDVDAVVSVIATNCNRTGKDDKVYFESNGNDCYSDKNMDDDMDEEDVGFGLSDGFDVLEIAKYSMVESK